MICLDDIAHDPVPWYDLGDRSKNSNLENDAGSGFTTVPEMPAARPDGLEKKNIYYFFYNVFFLVPFCGVLPFAF